MAFTLDQIAPWGRSFDEYVAMFCLTAKDLEKRVLGCGDGPASFNAAMAKRGKSIVSIDPLYAYSTHEIRQRIEAVYGTMMEQLAANQASYVWTTIHSPEHLGQVRMEAMAKFLDDFDHGKAEGRYLPHELPRLPFRNDEFELCLCSHLLFTYSGHLSADFHIDSVAEMCRVAREVRVFPLLDMTATLSRHFDPVCDYLNRQCYRWSIETVGYEFQRGGNQMLRVANS